MGASARPLGDRPCADWNEVRACSVAESKTPFVGVEGDAAARCSCSHTTSSPLEPGPRLGNESAGVTLAGPGSGSASAVQPAELVSSQSHQDRPGKP